MKVTETAYNKILSVCQNERIANLKVKSLETMAFRGNRLIINVPFPFPNLLTYQQVELDIEKQSDGEYALV